LRERTNNHHLVETSEQRHFVNTFPTKGMVHLLSQVV